MTTWTRVTDPDAATALLPPWFAARMMARRGSYGFLLATGDVLRARLGFVWRTTLALSSVRMLGRKMTKMHNSRPQGQLRNR